MSQPHGTNGPASVTIHRIISPLGFAISIFPASNFLIPSFISFVRGAGFVLWMYSCCTARPFHLTTAFLPCPRPQNPPFAHSDAEAVLRCFFFKKESDRLLPEKCSRLTIVIQLFIPARVPGLTSPHTRADEPAYPGR